MGTSLPESGRDWPTLKAEMVERGSGDAKWRDGKTAVYVFNAGDDVAQVQKEAYALYMSENGLGPLAFPSLRRMEDEVIGMALSLLHGPEDAAGAMTSGGTDSITMAVKAARDYARAERGLKAAGNLVIPRSAHPAFDKAAHMMDIEVRRVPVGEDLLADVPAMADAIDDGTIMLVGSAPCFPYGLIDDIAALSAIAGERELWLHVDACVGGFIAPFVRMNGSELPPFDFELPGVSSMSADLHKYGYCAKGASTVLFRSAGRYQHMPFDFGDWPGGRMLTPTLAGTRPGGAIAAAWAVMNFLGETGYQAKHRQVTNAREVVERGVRELGFEVLGAPQLGITAFSHPDADVIAVYKHMFRKGWFAGLTMEPKALHLMLSPVHERVTDLYLTDLADALRQANDQESDDGFEARYS
ncbi:MAG: aspartate aminotransferase family protein [Pseudomonadales bacterium]|nr:aspartate aminotransferase family protein [Pseudomonadales bacterium]NIX06612.1 aspartate aminotransferase family protein [Pseudomonadales bacterium]